MNQGEPLSDLVQRLRGEVPDDLPDDWDCIVQAGDIRALLALEARNRELHGMEINCKAFAKRAEDLEARLRRSEARVMELEKA